jgi:hypothetical protein
MTDKPKSTPDITRRRFIQLASTGIAVTAADLSVLASGAETGSWKTDPLAQRFQQPSAEARPRCYWYWMNGNITREGISADLEELSRIGIGGVNYFDIGLLPAGPVVNQDSEWHDLVEFAVNEAAKRNIKVSINCPGWSGSGGPWITPELSMQELSWSETTIEGGKKFSAILPQPPTRLGYYKDAAVIAFPTPLGDEPLPLPEIFDIDGNRLRHAASALEPNALLSAPLLSQSPGVPLATPVSHEKSGATSLPAKFDVVFPQPVQLRSIYLRGAREGGSVRAQLYAWDDISETFRPIARLNSHTSGPFADHIGTASFSEVKSHKFRLVFEARTESQQFKIETLNLLGGFRVSEWTLKAGFSGDPVNPVTDECHPQGSDVIALDQVIDLTGQMEAGGKLNWSAPAGRWTILRIGHTPTGIYLFPTPVGGAGLDCDKLSKEAADFHYEHCVKPLLQKFNSDVVRRAMAYYHLDSYESGWQNWTVKFPTDFHERRGYDLIKYLPALTGRVVGSNEITEKFLWDFRRTIGDLFADNNYGRLAERCHEDGIQLSAEPYGGPFEQLQVALRADQPMTEVWIQRPINGRKLSFQAVLAGHTAGRKIIGAESFTSGPPYGGMWKDHPFSLKALGDFIFCCGVNQYCVHVSTHQPFTADHMRPGFTCGQNGIHFDRGETWWHHGGKDWVSYISRCQSLLQTGEHVADVLYFQGNDSPGVVDSLETEIPDGYDFDACGSEILNGASVIDGRIVLSSGKTYRYLMLPKNRRCVTLTSLRKIVLLAKNGAKVVGELPQESPSLADFWFREEYEQLIHELGVQARIGQPFKSIVTADKLPPDFAYDEKQGMVLHSIHRKMGDTDIYFVASTSTNAGFLDCSFRISGKVPEVWHPDTGAIEYCTVYEPLEDRIRISLNFDPCGSVFIVFRAGRIKPHVSDVSFQSDSSRSLSSPGFPGLLHTDGRKLELLAFAPGKYRTKLPGKPAKEIPISALPEPTILEGPWTLSFPPGWGAPQKTILDKLISWPDHPNSGIRYFSGTAIYKITFSAIRTAPQCKLFLDLGRVEVIAEVRLNGKSLGTLWKPPFVCEITGMLLPKENELEVHITNLWPNRLIGDEQFPDDCTDNAGWKTGVIPAWPDWLKNGNPRPEPRRLTFCTWKHWHQEDPLLPSGLLGPVTLRQVRTVNII